MIEVEKKFYPSKKVYDFLYHQCEFVTEKIIDDIYLDTDDFKLMLANQWFRNRNGRFELKNPTQDYDSEMPTYFELFDPQEITRALGLGGGDLNFNALQANGFGKIAEFRSLRKKFKKDEFIIDLDTTDFGYELLEVELLVDKESEVPLAKDKIFNFIKKIDSGIDVCEIGKLRFLLLNKFPQLDMRLVEKGIYPPITL